MDNDICEWVITMELDEDDEEFLVCDNNVP